MQLETSHQRKNTQGRFQNMRVECAVRGCKSRGNECTAIYSSPCTGAEPGLELGVAVWANCLSPCICTRYCR